MNTTSYLVVLLTCIEAIIFGALLMAYGACVLRRLPNKATK